MHIKNIHHLAVCVCVCVCVCIGVCMNTHAVHCKQDTANHAQHTHHYYLMVRTCMIYYVDNSLQFHG